MEAQLEFDESFVYFGFHPSNVRNKRNASLNLLPEAHGGGEAVDSRVGFGRRNKTTEPENSKLAGTNATSPSSNVTFIAWRV
jgi:hypothetical protein